MPDQARVNAVRNYLDTYRGQFPEVSLVEKLRATGYTQEEIDAAIMPDRQPQTEAQQPTQNTFQEGSQNQQTYSPSSQNSFVNQSRPDTKKLLKLSLS